MKKNLEVKARLQSIERGVLNAESINARYERILHQTDTYFRVPSGRLKLREIEGEQTELIYYQRGETTTHRESNFEITPVHNASSMKALLGASLGVKIVVKKSRQLFMYQDTRIHLDEVEGLGSFLEFEVPVTGVLPEAQATMEFLIGVFEIKEADFIKESYSDMLINRK